MDREVHNLSEEDMINLSDDHKSILTYAGNLGMLLDIEHGKPGAQLLQGVSTNYVVRLEMQKTRISIKLADIYMMRRLIRPYKTITYAAIVSKLPKTYPARLIVDIGRSDVWGRDISSISVSSPHMHCSLGRRFQHVGNALALMFPFVVFDKKTNDLRLPLYVAVDITDHFNKPHVGTLPPLPDCVNNIEMFVPDTLVRRIVGGGPCSSKLNVVHPISSHQAWQDSGNNSRGVATEDIVFDIQNSSTKSSSSYVSKSSPNDRVSTVLIPGQISSSRSYSRTSSNLSNDNDSMVENLNEIIHYNKELASLLDESSTIFMKKTNIVVNFKELRKLTNAAYPDYDWWSLYHLPGVKGKRTGAPIAIAIGAKIPDEYKFNVRHNNDLGIYHRGDHGITEMQISSHVLQCLQVEMVHNNVLAKDMRSQLAMFTS